MVWFGVVLYRFVFRIKEKELGREAVNSVKGKLTWDVEIFFTKGPKFGLLMA